MGRCRECGGYTRGCEMCDPDYEQHNEEDEEEMFRNWGNDPEDRWDSDEDSRGDQDDDQEWEKTEENYCFKHDEPKWYKSWMPELGTHCGSCLAAKERYARLKIERKEERARQQEAKRANTALINKVLDSEQVLDAFVNSSLLLKVGSVRQMVISSILRDRRLMHTLGNLNFEENPNCLSKRTIQSILNIVQEELDKVEHRIEKKHAKNRAIRRANKAKAGNQSGNQSGNKSNRVNLSEARGRFFDCCQRGELEGAKSLIQYFNIRYIYKEACEVAMNSGQNEIVDWLTQTFQTYTR